MRTRVPATEAPAAPGVNCKVASSCGAPPLAESQNSTNPVGDASVPCLRLPETLAIKLVCESPPLGPCTVNETCGKPGCTVNVWKPLYEAAWVASPKSTAYTESVPPCVHSI